MKCSKCNQEEPNPYVVKSGSRKGKVHSHCRKCIHQNTLDRQRAFKQKLVDIKGGKCVKCGYNKSNAALQFHHLDPEEKDFQFSKYRLTSFEKNKDKIMKELDKCILVCANCHAEIHSAM